MEHFFSWHRIPRGESIAYYLSNFTNRNEIRKIFLTWKIHTHKVNRLLKNDVFCHFEAAERTEQSDVT
jgi:hypothetical protein